MKRFFLLFFSCSLFNILLAQDQQKRYDDVQPFVDGMAMVTKDSKIGFVNRSYEEVIPPAYFIAYDFSEGLAAVELYDSVALENGTSTWIFIDKTGKQVFPGQFEFVMQGFENGYAIVLKGGKRLVINKTGQVVVAEPDQLYFRNIKHKLVRVGSEKEKEGVLNLKGELIIPVEFDEVSILHPTLVVAEANGKYGFYDSNGKQLSKLTYEEYEVLDNGFVKVRSKKGWGLLNTAGKQIVAQKYDEIYDFREGLAKVEKKEKSGFIDEAGKVVIPVKYVIAYTFVNGKSRVSWKDKATYIDKEGNAVNEDYTDLPFLHSITTKEEAEKVFVDLLNELIQQYPYEGYSYNGQVVTDSIFTIRDGTLMGSFKEYTMDGVTIHSMKVPVAKVREVWYDANMGVYVDGETAIVQERQAGSPNSTKEYKTDMLHLASPGDGHHGEQWEGKLQEALKILLRFYQ